MCGLSKSEYHAVAVPCNPEKFFLVYVHLVLAVDKYERLYTQHLLEF